VDDPFQSSKYSIEHAKRRIRELESEIVAFSKTNPCAMVVEHDAKTAEDVHKVKLVKPVPAALSGIAFDTVNNLRSALDQAGFAVAVAGGKRGKNAHFPFGLTLIEVENRKKGRSKDIPKEIFDVMVSAKPYKGGNHLLWAVNKLSNTNKHEVIIPMAMASGNVTRFTGTVIKGPFQIKAPRWDWAKNEMEVMRSGHGGEHNMKFQVAFFVAIGNVDVLGCQPAVGILNAASSEVERVLMTIEAEARRIGLIV
jgi:hypothetical protein